MPPDPSHNPSVRRASRKQPGEDEIDSRRARGEISCAECRRLKLKCDKKLPCSSCIRRGCPSICPNGTLATGQGTRYVLSDTTQLHAKITEMGHRIQQLEDALAIFQTGVSNEVHPLLKEELLAIKFGPEKGRVQEKSIIVPDDTESETLIEALGTMSIGEGDSSATSYFGPSAGSEVLFLAGAEMDSGSWGEERTIIPPEVLKLSAAFPFGNWYNFEQQLDVIFEYLPPEPRAWSLCETYIEQASWGFRPIKRDELIEDVLSPIYKAVKLKNASQCFDHLKLSPHKFAVLFAVFGSGALVDLTLEPFSKEAEIYHHVARACLSLRSVFDSPDICTVQAVLLLAKYASDMGGMRYTMHSSWTMMSLATKIGQGLGLHRDPTRFESDPKKIQRRRELFWEMFSSELFYSLALGRPPSIAMPYIDCQLPEDDDMTVDDHGNTLVGYYRWKYEWAKEVFYLVIECSLTAKIPKYQTILDLDRKAREKLLPPHLSAFVVPPYDDQITPSTYMRRCLLSQFRSVTLLYLHRSFFAQAMLDHPENPLKSVYAPSFLAAYRCASGVIKLTLNHYNRFPALCGRWWQIWTHLFSASIIVGCIVTRSPRSSMASSAFIELGLASDLFEKCPMTSRRARSAMAIIYRMRQRAFQVFSQMRTGEPAGPLSVGQPDYGEDELALFGGQTKVLVSKLLSRSHKTKKEAKEATIATSSSSPDPALATSSPSSSEGDGSQDVHPSLVEYLSRYEPSPLVSTNTNVPEPRNTHFSTSNAAAAGQSAHPSWENWLSGSSSFSPTTTSQATFSSPSSRDSPFSGGFQTMDRDFLAMPTMETKQESVPDFGMMMTGDSGMDEQWLSFMKDSGFMQPPRDGGMIGGSSGALPTMFDFTTGL